MIIPTEHQVHYKRMILEELRLVYIAKNTDYGNAATLTYKEYGIISYVTRMRDKIERYRRISNNPAMVDEDIEEVLMDLCNYAIMCIADLTDKPYEIISMDISSKVGGKLMIPTSSEFMYEGFVEYLKPIAETQNDWTNRKWSLIYLKKIIEFCLQLLVNLKEEE